MRPFAQFASRFALDLVEPNLRQVLRDQQLSDAFHVLSDVPQDAPPAKGKLVKFMHLHPSGRCLPLPSLVAATHYPVDYLCRLDSLVLSRPHCLRIVSDDQLDCDPRGEGQARVDLSLAQPRPGSLRGLLLTSLAAGTPRRRVLPSHTAAELRRAPA